MLSQTVYVVTEVAFRKDRTLPNDRSLLTTLRACCKCGQHLPLAFFPKRRDGGAGRSYVCQSCNSERVRLWRQRRRDLRRESLA